MVSSSLLAAQTAQTNWQPGTLSQLDWSGCKKRFDFEKVSQTDCAICQVMQGLVLSGSDWCQLTPGPPERLNLGGEHYQVFKMKKNLTGCNRQHKYSQTIQSTENFDSMNLFKILCTVNYYSPLQALYRQMLCFFPQALKR